MWFVFFLVFFLAPPFEVCSLTFQKLISILLQYIKPGTLNKIMIQNTGKSKVSLLRHTKSCSNCYAIFSKNKAWLWKWDSMDFVSYLKSRYFEEYAMGKWRLLIIFIFILQKLSNNDYRGYPVIVKQRAWQGITKEHSILSRSQKVHYVIFE